eukprot:TRINITY_DN5255_c0_g1_i5.p1 TRINITY_DN5255_c0_g1~~TRINITY_DN5255_c0_g1_i5.p1  ORF type:complete len:428 (+),score=46.78 TRINITY_DN5255_c0_g1_i5:225-1508(+)
MDRVIAADFEEIAMESEDEDAPNVMPESPRPRGISFRHLPEMSIAIDARSPVTGAPLPLQPLSGEGPRLMCGKCKGVIHGTAVFQQGLPGPLHFGCIDSSEPWSSFPSGEDTVTVMAKDLVALKRQAEEAERLRAELARLQGELADQVAEAERNARLAEENARLREDVSQRIEVQQVLEAGLVQHMDAIEIWRNIRSFAGEPLQQPLSDPTLCEILQDALRNSSHSGPESQCTPMASVTIRAVRPIINSRLWQDYQTFRESMQKEVAWTGHPCGCLEPSAAWFDNIDWVERDDSINERLLLHGTRHSAVSKIAKLGFDERVARGGRYGDGAYFAENSCKSHQYSDMCAETGERCMILARVVLGIPYLTNGPMKSCRRPPLNPVTEVPFNSVVANPGIRTDTGPQQHREFVIFDRRQAYPEFVIYYSV